MNPSPGLRISSLWALASRSSTIPMWQSALFTGSIWLSGDPCWSRKLTTIFRRLKRRPMSAEQIWNDVRAQRERPVFKRVDERHPYDVYLGVDVNELPVLMLLSARPVEQLPRLKSLEVSQNVRHDGKFAVLISLSTPDLLHPFCSVCDDLIESLRSFTPAGAEAPYLLNRLEKWR